MVLRRALFWSGGGLASPTAGLAGISLLMALPVALLVALPGALTACSPIEAWRSVSGIDKNDPDPATAPFTRNLMAGEAGAYPNLGSVPPPPTQITSTAERQKLTQLLIAERGETQADAAKPTAASAVAAAAGAKPPAAQAAAPAGQTAAPGAQTAALASAAPAGTEAAAAAGPAPGRTGRGAAEAGRRKMDEPPEPGPLESSLQMPEVRSVPEPEAPHPPLPPPKLPPPTAVAPAAQTPPEAIAAGNPQPAPPLPVIAAVTPPATIARPETRRPVARAPVAALELPDASASLDGNARAQIERVAALYRERPGTVRVIAYAAPAPAGREPLAAYHAALDRAQVVAAALKSAGIPEDKVQSEAAPAGPAAPPSRVEIQFAP